MRDASRDFAEDLFLLDLGSSRFERLIRTSAKEEVPRLSPDGTKLAFARGHDLHVLDLATRAETRLTRDGSVTILNGTLSTVPPASTCTGRCWNSGSGSSSRMV